MSVNEFKFRIHLENRPSEENGKRQNNVVSLWKTIGKVSHILVTLTSRSDSNFERSNISLKENKPDGADPNSNGLDHYVQKNEEKTLQFSVDRSKKA